MKPDTPMRPIVCCVGTWINNWSLWLSVQLKKLTPHIPSYIKDYQQVLDELRELDLPPHAYVYVGDANAMYNNIDLEHAFEVIFEWLDELMRNGLLPDDFPLEAVKRAMVYIMQNNVFGFGTLFFLQLIGSAMGTSSAVMFATIYFACHEVKCIQPKHGHNLLYNRRFIDDIIGIWVGNHTDEWEAYKADLNNFGILTWEVGPLSREVDFLDLTLRIEDGRIVSKTFQKPLNLYLYLPPSSSHPPGCIKGTIYGLVGRYYAQNTFRHDYIYFIQQLYRHLLDRGWDNNYVKRLILEADDAMKAKGACTNSRSSPDSSNDAKNRLFFHLQYHPDGISRKRTQQLFEEHCGKLFRKELQIDRPTIAYSRPFNIGDKVTKAKLHQAPGRTSDIILGEYKAGLHPS